MISKSFLPRPRWANPGPLRSGVRRVGPHDAVAAIKHRAGLYTPAEVNRAGDRIAWHRSACGKG